MDDTLFGHLDFSQSATESETRESSSNDEVVSARSIGAAPEFLIEPSIGSNTEEIADIGAVDALFDKDGEPVEIEEPLESDFIVASDEVTDSDTLYKGQEQVDWVEQSQRIDESLEQVFDKLTELDKLFQTKIQRSNVETQIVDKMHEELQIYKNDLYSQLIKPIIKDIITLREHILKLSSDCSAKPEAEQFIPLRTFASFGDDLARILEDNDVEIHRAVTGDVFDPLKQKVVEKIETREAALNKTIAKAVGEGYSIKGRTFSAQKVSVYSYVAEVLSGDKPEGEIKNNG